MPTDHVVLKHTDLKAVNTEAHPDNVVPQKAPLGKVVDGRLEVVLAPLTWNMVRLGRKA